MLKDINIQNGRITLTCTLPQDLATFATANETPAGAHEFHLEPVAGLKRPPMKVDYLKPATPQDNASIVLSGAPGTALFYEDAQNLAALLGRRSPVTHVRLIEDDAAMEQFLAKARKTLPGLFTNFYPDAETPRAEATTAHGRFELKLDDTHPNFTSAKGEGIIRDLNAIYGITYSGSDRYFTTNIYGNDAERFAKAADMLVKHGIVPEERKEAFKSETRAQLARHFAYGELATIERFFDHATPQRNPETGEMGLGPYMQQMRDNQADYVQIMNALAKTGEFKDVPADTLRLLKTLATMDPLDSGPEAMAADAALKKMVPDYHREQAFVKFCNDFLPEINEALRPRSRGAEGAGPPRGR